MRKEKRETRKSLTAVAKVYAKNEELKWNWRSRKRNVELFSASVKKSVLMLTLSLSRDSPLTSKIV